MKSKITLFALALTLLAACATKPTATEDTRPIPADRLYPEFQPYAKADANRARVTFTRDSGILGAAASLSLLVNGDLIARIRRKETVSIYVPAGKNDIALGPGKLTSGPVGQGLIEAVLDAKSGANYAYRVGLDMNVGLVLERTDDGA